ncbi:MAG: penicillin-binding transpeptidase domain-containing protein [Oscillospiraceae bacterium]|nr:penicillin-binding transpeptidase domain-containing protein [Oscillospiraceae bacterium]
MKKTEKRILCAFAAMVVLLSFCMTQIFRTTVWGNTLAQTAAEQQTLKLHFTLGRGTLYDRSGRPLTGGKASVLAAVEPSKESAAALCKVLSQGEMQEVYTQMKKGLPFLTELPAPVKGDGILCFSQEERRTAHPLAPHTVGYLDNSGHGACGAEKAFDSVLSRAGVTTQVCYTVDALRHPLPGEVPQVTSSIPASVNSAVLTLDSSVQKIAESSVGTAFQKGAVVVLKAGSGEILASVSLPGFDPSSLSKTLKSTDGALLDRTLQPYSVGSVFKLTAAAAALENGLDANAKYSCHGYETVNGLRFHCAEEKAHGRITLQEALAQSCNSYFISCMQKVPLTQFLQMTRRLGFGQQTEIAPQLAGNAGTLPSLKELQNPRALANFSFGQGSLTATPLQIAAMVNAVASSGRYTQPSLSLGLADAAGHIVQRSAEAGSTRAFSQKTARLLRDGMVASVLSGTGRAGRPAHVQAAAKTATAQTGRFAAGKEQVICWYAGFFPAGAPKYVVAVMAENGKSGGETCGPVFQRIANALYPND